MVRATARYLTPSATHRRLGLVCLGAGQKREGAACPPRTLNCHAAVFVTHGRGWLSWDGGQRPTGLSGPMLFWLFPGLRHTYGPDAGGWEEMWVLFDGPAAVAYEDLGYMTRSDPVVALSNPEPVRAALGRILDACGARRSGVEVEAGLGVHELIRESAVARPNQGHDDSATLATLADAACSPLTVRQHADRLNMSLSTLRRLARRTAGCSPKEYLQRARLNRAKELLAGTSLTVAEVARSVGYDDPAYFSRTFSSRTGMAPTSFRRQEQRAPVDRSAATSVGRRVMG